MQGTSAFRRYLLPGFVFQSVVIGGGYGTGRELVEFFLAYGPLGGLLGMTLVAMVIWSAVAIVSYEFARVFRTYNYRDFLRRLLGRGWILFELGYVTLLLIVLAVIGSAAGSLLEETFGVRYAVGVLGIMAAVGYLVLRGSTTIERVLTLWSFVLYGAYFVLFLWSVSKFRGDIASHLLAGEAREGWFLGGVRYAAYSLALVPAIVFVIRHLQTRRDAVIAGTLTGPIGMIPGILFYVAMVGQYPEIVERPVPVNFLLEILGSPSFQIIFQLVLFGTLIETGTGMIHAVNERIAGTYRDAGRQMPIFLRPAAAVLLLMVASLLSRVGLVSLIAKGYGTLTWLFVVVFVIPVLTWGVWKIATVPARLP